MRIKDIKNFMNSHGSTILTVIACVGVVATSVTAVKGHEKAQKALKELPEDLEGKDKGMYIVKRVLPHYILPAVVGATTIGCTIGAHVSDKNAAADATAAYLGLMETYTTYRKTNIEQNGKEADVKIIEQMARTHCEMHWTDIDTPDRKCIFVEPITGNTVECYERTIMDAEYHLNRNFALRGCASLNEFFEFAGFPMGEQYDEMGWTAYSGIGWVDFEHREIDRDSNGTPIVQIDYVFYPDDDWAEEMGLVDFTEEEMYKIYGGTHDIA